MRFKVITLDKILNSMLHTSIESHLTCISWVLVVISQTTNLTLSFYFAIIYISEFQMENLNTLLISTFWKNFNNLKINKNWQGLSLKFCPKYLKHLGIPREFIPHMLPFVPIKCLSFFYFLVYSQFISICFVMKYFFNLLFSIAKLNTPKRIWKHMWPIGLTFLLMEIYTFIWGLGYKSWKMLIARICHPSRCISNKPLSQRWEWPKTIFFCPC